VTWIAPNKRGSDITGYNLYVQNSLGVSVEYLPCAQLQTLCSIALTDLIQDYELTEGQNIIVQISATNYYGTSPLSSINLSSVKKVETVPHKPLSAPQRGALTTQNQIEVLINPFPTTKNGGS
jgi:hypothetical protein